VATASEKNNRQKGENFQIACECVFDSLEATKSAENGVHVDILKLICS